MIEETLRRLEERIRASESAGDNTRADLLDLVAKLRAEFSEVAAAHHDEAAAIARQADLAAQAGPVADIEESMLEFDSAHPRLVALFRSLMRTLADAGI